MSEDILCIPRQKFEEMLAEAHNNDTDRLLKIDEAAARLGTSPDWLYRNANRFSFTVRLSARQLRFSARGIDLFIANRRDGHNSHGKGAIHVRHG
jgi:predicted DNA-binding transcriptional regulator AlpA